MTAAVVLLIVIILALAAPFYASTIAHTDPFRSTLTAKIVVDGKRVPVMAPSTEGLGLGVTPIGPTFQAQYFLGADTQGRDVAARLLYGGRNSLMIAIAPTATIASIAGCYECVEPQVSNLFKRETLSGDFLQVNRYLVGELKQLGLWTPEMRDAIKLADGSIQNLPQIPEALRTVYRTAWELPMRSLIDMAAARGAFIDQSASLNLFMESPNIGALSSMYMYAWKQGIKTCYYLRSRPATKIAKTTVSSYTPAQAVACSLENPEACEACQ